MKNSKKIDTDKLIDMGRAAKVQHHQVSSAEQQMAQMKNAADALSAINDRNLDALDMLLMEAEALCAENNVSVDDLTENDYMVGAEIAQLDNINVKIDSPITLTQLVEFDDSMSWKDYTHNVNVYARSNNIDLASDPFITTMSEKQASEIKERVRNDYYERKPECDKYDYMIASFCGVVSGLIDSFFVGMPKESMFGNWTDAQAEGFIQNITKTIWKNDKRQQGKPKKCPDNLVSAVSYLERRFGVNYDARYASDLMGAEGILEMSSSNHHIKSLAHSPDIIGLIFSIIDQFTGKASFVEKGKLIRLVPVKTPQTYILEGSNMISKVFCGFSNWIGHLLSDMVGSSSTIKKDGRGTGIGMPFYELLGFCNFGNIDGMSISELSVKVFENGYDLRFGITQSIPVVINELLIRLMYILKYHFYNKVPLKNLIKFKSDPELNRMLLVGHGALCLVDTTDAAIRSGGNNILSFILHLNGVAWTRFAFASLTEIKSIYHRNHINVDKLDKELEQEWHKMLSDVTFR